MQELPEENEPAEKGKNSLKNYAKYSAIGFQMVATIGVFTYAGYRIDEYRQAKSPLVTAFLSLLGVFISLYLVIQSIRNQKP
jgi:hypothetical protein